MDFLPRVAVLAAMLAWPIAYSAGQTNLLEHLRTELPKNEKALRNLRVDGTCWDMLWDATTNGWKYAGESEVTAWYLGAPGSKVRIDFHKQVGLWEGGLADLLQESFTLAYDGRVNRKLNKTQGPPQQQNDILRGKLDSQRDLEVAHGNFASGWGYSLYGFWDNQGKRISSVFESKDWVLAAKEDSYEGVKCVQLTAVGTESHTWYLDPTRGYAILGYEKFITQPQQSLVTRLTVEQLAQPAPGVYYPTQAFAEGFVNGVPFNRSQFVASKVVANDPSFSEDVFTIEWPPGTVVEDKIAGKVFIAGKEQPKPEVPEQAPEVQPVPAAQSATPTASGTQRSVRRFGVGAFVIGALVVSTLAVIGAICLRRQK